VIKIDGARLIAAVIESGMGEVQLCATAGVGHQTFAKMARGQMVRFPSIAKVCKVLNLAPAEIIKEISDEALQTQGQPELVSETGGHADEPKDNAQSPRLAVVGRVPG
jgi:DNA-binding Xre family transcriptional regulator